MKKKSSTKLDVMQGLARCARTLAILLQGLNSLWVFDTSEARAGMERAGGSPALALPAPWQASPSGAHWANDYIRPVSHAAKSDSCLRAVRPKTRNVCRAIKSSSFVPSTQAETRLLGVVMRPDLPGLALAAASS